MKRNNLSCLNKNSLLLPVKSKVVFVDWFGVLSEKVFWDKYLENDNHRLHKKVSNLKLKLFEKNDIIVNEWMRGNYSYKDIIEKCCNEMSHREKRTVENSLLSYCADISLNHPLFETLKTISDKTFIVLATDNMDCFHQSLYKLPQLGIFDAVLSSNFLGVLKKESPNRFFGNWLKNHDLSFKNALLIDDSGANCEEFRKCGGVALQYKKDDKIVFNRISGWLDN